MKLATLFLGLICTVAACAKKATVKTIATTDSVTTQTNIPGQYTYLALGDSYTIGQSVNNTDSFPYQLYTQLAASGLQQPNIIAQTGWTTQNLIDAVNNSSLKNKTYDVVTVLIGVNDQYGGGSSEAYRPKFVQLLNMAIARGGNKPSHVYLLSIPDWGVTPYAGGNEATIGPQIDAFNAVNKAESLKAGVNYIDITGLSKMAATDLSLVANDGLHPSAKMYASWVQKLAPEFMGRLGK
jgi:lysophospholipase L1-like esterase